jgi:tartrate-resistant acid phosphatase type 5
MSHSVKFFAISDFGSYCNEIKATSLSMNAYASFVLPPDFILGLGDNFYDVGVTSISSREFDIIWRNQFLSPYTALRVPWKLVLGNHDYYGNPAVQVDYHYSKQFNSDKLWYMPSRCYRFIETPKPSSNFPLGSQCFENQEFSVEFFALDTNGADSDIQYVDPGTIATLHTNIRDLLIKAKQSTSRWKFLFCHHPCYTASLGHGAAMFRLRDTNPYFYKPIGRAGFELPGFGLEKVLIEAGFDAIFAGHEHVFQHHVAHNIHHFGCGASGGHMRPHDGLLGGRNQNIHLNWIGRGDQYGFVAVEVEYHQMIVKFIGADGSILHTVTVEKEEKEKQELEADEKLIEKEEIVTEEVEELKIETTIEDIS